MTPESALAEARRRIARAKESRAAVLDLGDLALARPPDELGRLPNLRVLALGRNRPVLDGDTVRWELDGHRDPGLTSARPVARLRGLDVLDLGGCRNLAALPPMAALTGLTTLNLSGCNSLVDLAPLAGLTYLSSLDLSGCLRVGELDPLAELAGVMTLDLSRTAVVNLAPLAGWPVLKALDLSHTPVADLSPLAGMGFLERLSLVGCRRLRSFAPLRPLVPILDALFLHGCEFVDLPPEVCGRTPDENVVGPVGDYYAGLGAGAAPDAEVKLCVLGNGGVGKTRMCLRLRGRPCDETPASTHGIEVHDFALRVPGRDHDVRVHLWDFGGQEV